MIQDPARTAARSTRLAWMILLAGWGVAIVATTLLARPLPGARPALYLVATALFATPAWLYLRAGPRAMVGQAAASLAIGAAGWGLPGVAPFLAHVVALGVVRTLARREALARGLPFTPTPPRRISLLVLASLLVLLPLSCTAVETGRVAASAAVNARWDADVRRIGAALDRFAAGHAGRYPRVDELGLVLGPDYLAGEPPRNPWPGAGGDRAELRPFWRPSWPARTSPAEIRKDEEAREQRKGRLGPTALPPYWPNAREVAAGEPPPRVGTFSGGKGGLFYDHDPETNTYVLYATAGRLSRSDFSPFAADIGALSHVLTNAPRSREPAVHEDLRR